MCTFLRREDKIAEVWTDTRNFKQGGPPLRKYIHSKVRMLQELRHNLFKYACGTKDGDDDDDKIPDDDKKMFDPKTGKSRAKVPFPAVAVQSKSVASKSKSKTPLKK
jgi:hypothetical protein